MACLDKNSARFGAAVANAGDLDGDGTDEIAVGAPFEDAGRGAVRIYYGRANIESIQGLQFPPKASE